MQSDAIDPEKLQEVLTDDSMIDVCDLKRAAEMVALLEAQLKDMNSNLDSISEYALKMECKVNKLIFLFKYLHFAVMLCRYRQKALLYNERVEELNAATQERDDLKRHHDGLRKKRLVEL